MKFTKVTLKSHYNECAEHKTKFGPDDTYILVTVTTPYSKPFGIAQFQACNDSCASNHLFNWLAIEHNVSFLYSTPEIRRSIDKKIVEERREDVNNRELIDASLD